MDVKRVSTLLFSLFIYYTDQAQDADLFPFYRNSLSLEIAAPTSYAYNLIQVTSRDYTNTASFLCVPATAFTFERNFKKLWYGEVGILPYTHDATFGSISNKFEFTAYGGALMKVKLIQHLFFTPSLDLSFSQMQSWTYIGIGPTLGFEYFFGKRFSVNTDLLNINYGFAFFPHENINYNGLDFLEQHGRFSINKVLSIGLHYNFGTKK